jgi:hypothetical protein
MSSSNTGGPPSRGALSARLPQSPRLPSGNEPRLVPTDLNLREAIPILFAFLVVLPFLATPWILGIALRFGSGGHCGSTLRCVVQFHAAIRLFELVTTRSSIPPAVIAHPIVADLLLGLVIFVAVLLLAVALHIPIFGAISPVLKVTERKRSRTASSYPFTIVEPNKPHRLAVHIKGTFAGYPGGSLITLKVQLPGGIAMQVDHDLKPASDGDRGGITNYVFDPFFYQFTPPKAGRAELWIGYGNGPDCKMSVTINRRH